MIASVSGIVRFSLCSGSPAGSLRESRLCVEPPDGFLLAPSIKENEPLVNTADAYNLVYHERIVLKELLHFFLMEGFNDDEQVGRVCIGSPRRTVPSSKS
jgi:hypothetical protein